MTSKTNSSPKPAKAGGRLNPAGRNRAGLISQRRNKQMVDQVINSANIADRTNQKVQKSNIFGSDQLKIVCLGGQDQIGSKNMVVIEYGPDALVVDCGHDLGLDLPGINYSIPDTSYLTSIKSKLRGYVISHGHLDHIGGLPHILTHCPAPVYGSLFTIGMVKIILANQAASARLLNSLKFITLNMDNHQSLKLGRSFSIELVRVTHSIPESSLVVVKTPLGTVINTGDFRLDPEPLDKKPTDLKRLSEIGQQGTLVLLSESTNAQMLGRTQTEHTLQKSYSDLIAKAPGRLFVASFSSNINRIQMIINAAVEAGRQVAIDGRSMIQNVELSIKLGLLKVPQKTIVSVANLANLANNRLLLMCTGSQGEMGASLQKMSLNEHRHINLKAGDTVVLSSKPIPGNENAYQKLAADLVSLGCRVFKAPTWEVDGAVGPLHVSGHGGRDELREMIELVKPRYLVPIYANAEHRQYHRQVAIDQAGLKPNQVFLVNNGDLIAINKQRKLTVHPGVVPAGSILVDDAGQIIPSVVIKDRMLLTESGLVVVVLVIDKKTGALLTSPDIITRGFIHIKDNEDLMTQLRLELKRAVSQRYNRVSLDRFKSELRDHLTNFLYNQTQRTPIVIPVLNNVSNGSNRPPVRADKTLTRPA